MKKTENVANATIGNAESAFVTLTVDSGNTGQFDFSGASITVSHDTVLKLARGNGLEGEIRSLLGPLDKHPLFGDFSEKNAKRPAGYKRGDVAYSAERAEVVRSLIAKGTETTGNIAVTVSQYVDSALVATAKKVIARKDTQTEREALATKAGFPFDDWNELNVENVEFVRAVASLVSAI